MNDKKVREPTKKKLFTIDDVLSSDEITKYFSKLNSKRSEIKHIVAVYVDKDGCAHYAPDEEMLFSDAVGLLAWAQWQMLHDNNEEEGE